MYEFNIADNDPAPTGPVANCMDVTHRTFKRDGAFEHSRRPHPLRRNWRSVAKIELRLSVRKRFTAKIRGFHVLCGDHVNDKLRNLLQVAQSVIFDSAIGPDFWA